MLLKNGRSDNMRWSTMECGQRDECVCNLRGVFMFLHNHFKQSEWTMKSRAHFSISIYAKFSQRQNNNNWNVMELVGISMRRTTASTFFVVYPYDSYFFLSLWNFTFQIEWHENAAQKKKQMRSVCLCQWCISKCVAFFFFVHLRSFTHSHILIRCGRKTKLQHKSWHYWRQIASSTLPLNIYYEIVDNNKWWTTEILLSELNWTKSAFRIQCRKD